MDLGESSLKSDGPSREALVRPSFWQKVQLQRLAGIVPSALTLMSAVYLIALSRVSVYCLEEKTWWPWDYCHCWSMLLDLPAMAGAIDSFLLSGCHVCSRSKQESNILHV